MGILGILFNGILTNVSSVVINIRMKGIIYMQIKSSENWKNFVDKQMKVLLELL